MKGLVCEICGYVALNGSVPENCPVCHAAASAFKEKEDAIKKAQDPNNVTDAEKKHTPAITVVKTCGLIPEDCVDVHVKVGEIQHPMETEHYIEYIDFYIDKEFISRVKLTPAKLNPAAALHIKAVKGALTAISNCNIHGNWINETQL